jgi:Ca2+-transporting ATPase
VFHYGLQTGNEARALTLGFTTFVLFQLFNAVNVRTEDGSAFNRRFFDNPMLWLSLSAVLALQVVVVSWAPAQNLFNVTALSLSDWGLATCTATSVLFFDEIRKLGSRWLRTVTVA